MTTPDDAVPGDPRSATLSFTAGTGYTVGTQSTHEVRIEDDDREAPELSFSASASELTEGQAVELEAALVPRGSSCDTLRGVDFSYEITPATSLTVTCAGCTPETFAPTVSGDVGTGSFRVRLPTCATGTTPPVSTPLGLRLSVTTPDDAEPGDPRSATLSFTAGIGYTVGSRPTHEVRIEDDDREAPELSFSAAASELTEGQAVELEAALVPRGSSCDMLREVNFAYEVTPATSLTVTCDGCTPETFAPTVSGNVGTGSFRVRLPTCATGTTPPVSTPLGLRLSVSTPDDAEPGDPRSARLSFTAGSGYTVGTQSTHEVRIEDDDRESPELSFSASTSSLTEGQTVELEAALVPRGSSCDTLREVDFAYEITPATSLTVTCASCTPETFAPTVSGDIGTGSFRVQLPTCATGTTPPVSTPLGISLSVSTPDDAVPGDPRSATLSFTAGTGYTVGTQSTHEVRIEDDDREAPELSFSASTSELTEGQTVELEAALVPRGSSCDTLLGLDFNYSIDKAALLTMTCGSCIPQTFTPTLIGAKGTGSFRLQPSLCPMGSTPKVSEPLAFSLSVTPPNDGIVGEDRNADIFFEVGSGYELGARASHQVQIREDDFPLPELHFREASSRLKELQTIAVAAELLPRGNNCDTLRGLSFNYLFEQPESIQVTCDTCNPETLGTTAPLMSGKAEGSFALQLENCPAGQSPATEDPIGFTFQVSTRGVLGSNIPPPLNLEFGTGTGYVLGTQASHRIQILERPTLRFEETPDPSDFKENQQMISVQGGLIPRGNDCDELRSLSFEYRITQARFVRTTCSDCNPEAIGPTVDLATGAAQGRFALKLENCLSGQTPPAMDAIGFTLQVAPGEAGFPGNLVDVEFHFLDDSTAYSLGDARHDVRLVPLHRLGFKEASSTNAPGSRLAISTLELLPRGCTTPRQITVNYSITRAHTGLVACRGCNPSNLGQPNVRDFTGSMILNPTSCSRLIPFRIEVAFRTNLRPGVTILGPVITINPGDDYIPGAIPTHEVTFKGP